MSMYLFFKKVMFSAGIKVFNSLPPSVTILKDKMAKFTASLRKYLHMQSCYYVDEYFICKDNLQYCFGKMFAVFYTVS
jgi:hypothetical protein